MSTDSPLIMVVAHEDLVADEALQALVGLGFPVQRCRYGREALQLAIVGDVGLVVAAVDLPDMDAYELQAAYADALPHRATPFVVITDAEGPEEAVPALAEGAVGFLLRPVSSTLLEEVCRRATVGEAGPVGELVGELGERSLGDVLEYCRRGALSGELEVQSPDLDALLDFVGGELLRDEYDLGDEELAELARLRVGSFAIRPSWTEPAGGSTADPPTGDPEEVDFGLPPPPKVTGVAVGDHLVNVETEYEDGADGRISTVVSVDGKERKRTTSIPPPRSDRDALSQYVAEQHAAVEAGVLGRVEALLAKKQKRPDPSHQELHRFIGLVRRACARRDFAGAREILSGARALFPADPTLSGYDQLVRRKLDGA